MSQNTIEIIIKADGSAAVKGLEATRKELGAVGKEANQTGGIMSKLNGALGAVGLGVSFAGLATGAAALGSAMIGLAMDAEQTEVAFNTLLGSAEETEAMLKDLRDFAAGTPFQFTDLTQASKLMLAFGFSAKEIIPVLTDVGDAVAGLGLGSQGVEQVIRALGQMRAKGKVTAEEMMQLTEAGIPGWRYLAQAMGKSTAEVMKLSEKGLIPANEAVQMLLAGMREDFGGLMEAQSQTAAGAVSNLQDSLVALGTDIGDLLLPAFKNLVGGLQSATGALRVILFGTSELNKALALHSEEVAVTSGSYRDYMAEMTRAQVAVGRLDQAEADHLVSLLDKRAELQKLNPSIESLAAQYKNLSASQLTNLYLTGDITEEQLSLVDAYNANESAIAKITEQTGLYSEAQYDASKASGVAAIATESLANNWQGLGELYAKTPEGIAATNAELEKQAAALKASEDSVQLLKVAMAGAVGKELKSFADKQAEIRLKTVELESEIYNLEQLPYLTADQGAQLLDLHDKLRANQQAAQDNAAAHEDATKRILFGYLEQRLALDGLTQGEQDALMAVANQWGLVDSASLQAYQDITAAADAFNAGGSLDALQSDLAAVAAEAGIVVSTTLSLADALNGIPRNIDVRMTMIGDENFGGWTPPTTTAPVTGGAPDVGFGGMRAVGGDVMPGFRYLVGENGPEWLVPQSPGTVIPGGSTGDTYNVTINRSNQEPDSVQAEIKLLQMIGR